jgi:isopenicillin-N epimerase
MTARFLLDPAVAHLNHGSFGACPRPVFEAYQQAQRRLERNPTGFLVRELPGRIDAVRERLATELGADVDRLILVRNPTAAMHGVIRSLRLAEGDEIVATDQEYGPVILAWKHLCGVAGATWRETPLPLEAADDELADTLLAACGPRTRAIVVSWICSPLGCILPVAAICRAARARGIVTVVDGAHAPGQVPVALESVGADVVLGACHKWLLAPKGAAFLWVAEGADWVEPPVISAGWDADSFAERGAWLGTDDPSAALAVPAALDFRAEHDWPAEQARARSLAVYARDVLEARLGGPSPVPPVRTAQLVAVPLPDDVDGERLRGELAADGIEVAASAWRGRQYLRVSLQAYNDEADVERLDRALHARL